MDSINQQVTAKFAAFEQEHDPARVLEALDEIEAAEQNMPLADTAARRLAVARRLRFFAALDRHIDPQWDSKRLPVKGATRPSTRGVIYPSGEVDPSTIPDPAERARYESELAANKAYEKQYDVQFQLRRIDERALRFLELLLAERFTKSETDRREIEELLAAAPLLEPRKQKLRDLLLRQARGG